MSKADEAYQRVRRAMDTEDALGVYAPDEKILEFRIAKANREYEADMTTLAEEYIAVRTQKEAEAKENATFATWEWLEEIGLQDACEGFRDQKLYWLTSSTVYVAVNACPGGWRLTLFTGTGLRFYNPTRGQINAILKALRGEV